MKFQINIELDEKEAKLTQKEAVNYVLDSMVDILEKTGAYYDIGCNIDSIVSGLTS